MRLGLGEAYVLAWDGGTAYWLFGPDEDALKGDRPCRTGWAIVVSPPLPFVRVPDPGPLLQAGEDR